MAYTEAINERQLEVADRIWHVGQSLFINSLSVLDIKALLNPRECEYRLRLDDETFIIRDGGEGPEFLQDYGDGYVAYLESDEMWLVFRRTGEIELISCKPHAHKPKPLTCYMTEDNGGEPYLCVVNRQGGTEFFSQDSVHNSAVLDRDTIQALTNPVGCQFVLDFGFDHWENSTHINVTQNEPRVAAALIAKASFLYPKFKITNIRSA